MAKTLNKISPLTLKGMIATARKEGKITKAPDGSGRFVFTGLRTASGSKYERHMAAEALMGALRRMGYSKEEMTAHGFRALPLS